MTDQPNTNQPASESSQRPFCPYVGLRPFGEVDSQRFSGRHNEIRTVLKRLQRHPLVAIVGASGVGKTSLVNAGVVPALHDESDAWVVRTMRPGGTPVQRLLSVFGGRRAAGSPSKMIASVLGADGDSLLLVIDNFEDIFVLANESDRTTFQKALLRFTTVPECHILLNVRADFYGDLLSAPIWPKLRTHTVTLTPLNRKRLREAIVQPATDVDVHLDPALIDRLVSDAADDHDALPRLQETLMLLWSTMERRDLPLSAYEELVRRGAGQATFTGGKLAPLQVGLARNADDAFDSLTKRQQKMARHTFLRLLSLDPSESMVLTEASLGDLRATFGESTQLEQMLQRLTQARVLTTDQDAGTVAITHEALVRGWPILRAWVAEWQLALQTREYMEGRALQWSDAGESAEELLLDEADLPEAERWLESPVAADVGYSDRVSAFIAASRNAAEKAHRHRTEATQQGFEDVRAALQERTAELNEERLHNEELRRERRIFRVLSLGLGLFFILALIGGIVAGTDRQRALDAQATARTEAEARATVVVGLQSTVEAQQAAGSTTARRMALSNELAGHAVTQLRAGDTDMALLLAREAISTTYHHDGSVVPAADAALREALIAAGWQAAFNVHEASITGIAFMPDGERLLSASDDGTARIWSTSTGAEQAILTGHDGAVLNVATARSGQRVATAGEDATIRIWNPDTSDEPTILSAHTEPVRAVTFGPDGQRLVSASDDGTVRIWDAGNGQQLQQFSLPGGTLTAQFSPDGTRVVAGGHDGIARVLDMASGEQIFATTQHAGAVAAAGFSTDGTLLVTADGSACNRSCFVYLWDAVEGTLRRTLPAAAPVTDVRFAEVGTQLLATDSSGSVSLWNIANGERQTDVQSSVGSSPVATIRPDGQWGAVGSAGGTVELVPLVPVVLMELAEQHVQRRPAALTCEERVQFLDAGDPCSQSP